MNKLESFFMRTQMPQISSDGIQSLVDNKIAKPHKIPPTKLRATQKDFDYGKIAALRNTTSAKPIIISKDFFVVDGHHRWLAHDWNENINAVMLDMNWKDSIKYLNNFSKNVH